MATHRHKQFLNYISQLWITHKIVIIVMGLFAVVGVIQIVRSYAASVVTRTVEGEFIHIIEMPDKGHPIEQFQVRTTDGTHIDVDLDSNKIKNIPKTGSKVRIKVRGNDPVKDEHRMHATQADKAPALEVADQAQESVEVIAPPSPDSEAVDESQIKQEPGQVLAEVVTKRIALIRVNMNVTDGSTGVDIRPLRSLTKENELWAHATSADRFWNSVSYGNIAITKTIYDVTINVTNATSCTSANETSWLTKADAAATAQGINLGLFTNKYYIFPIAINQACNYSGKGYLGGNTAWSLNGYDATPYTTDILNSTYSHELGHNFGLQHTNSKECSLNGVRVSISASCTDVEYGDPFSIMGMPGIRSMSLSGYQKLQLGLLPSTKIRTISSSGSYTIASTDINPTSTTLPQLLRIAIPGSIPSQQYEFEYRAPFGLAGSYDANDKVVNGFSTRVVLAPTSGYNYHSYLLDAVPSTSSLFDAPFRNEVFEDTARKIKVQLISKSATTMVLNVSINGVIAPIPSGDNVAPELQFTAPTNDSTHTIGSTLRMAANSYDNLGVTKVEFYDNSNLINTDTTSPFEFNWNTAGATNGTHNLSVKSYDAANNIATSVLRVTLATSVVNVNDSVIGTGLQQFNYQGFWGVVTGVGKYLNDEHTSSVTGSVAEIKFKGNQILWYGTYDTSNGQAAVSIDGGPETIINTYWTSRFTDWLIYRSPVLTNTEHMLKIRVTGLKDSRSTGAKIDIDRVQIIGFGAVDSVKPTVSLTSPSNGSSIAQGSTANLAAIATDNVGVTKVEFYSGTTLLGADTNSPYTFNWNTTGQAAGLKALTARAYDAAGNITASAVVSLTISGSQTPRAGDANNDGRVNGIDYSILAEHDGENYPAADFNRDGVIGAADLAILLSNWTW